MLAGSGALCGEISCGSEQEPMQSNVGSFFSQCLPDQIASPAMSRLYIFYFISIFTDSRPYECGKCVSSTS